MRRQKSGKKIRRGFRKLSLLAPLFLAIAVSGVAAAYMIRQTPYAINEFETAFVECEVAEIMNSDATAKTSIKIKNTGNIDAYLRLRIVSYWENSKGEIKAKASVSPSFLRGEDWLKGSGDIYYYQIPVSPEAFTGELLASQLVLSESTEADGTERLLQVVEIFAEAIQAMPENAVTDSWGVKLDTNGRIVAIP